MALRILFLTLSLLCCEINAITQGRVGLWSDSECNSKSGRTSNFGEQDPINLNFTLLPDVCGVPRATVHSYRVLQNATCANGTTAMFYYYNSNNCTADPTDEDPNPGLAKRVKDRRQFGGVLGGECLALIAYNSLAFICEGVTPDKLQFNSLLTSAISPTSASSSTIPTTSSRLILTSSNQSATVSNSSTSNSSASISSASISSASISSASISSATISSATSSPIASSSGSASGLSAGASAGAGVGSAIGVLAIAALCSVFFLLPQV